MLEVIFMVTYILCKLFDVDIHDQSNKREQQMTTVSTTKQPKRRTFKPLRKRATNPMVQLYKYRNALQLV